MIGTFIFGGRINSWTNYTIDVGCSHKDSRGMPDPKIDFHQINDEYEK